MLFDLLSSISMGVEKDWVGVVFLIREPVAVALRMALFSDSMSMDSDLNSMVGCWPVWVRVM